MFRRLSEIRREKQAEVSRLAGTKVHWRALEREFQSTIRGLSAQLAVRRELQRPFEEFAAVIDYHLHQPERRQEDVEYVDGLFTLLRQASGAIERDARGLTDDRGRSVSAPVLLNP